MTPDASARSALRGSIGAAAPGRGVRWLQVLEGDAPVLLIAPHGGQAGAAARATLNPKVNDLYTAEITRELARRLGAGAIINTGMDRNRLDLNRLSQVMREAPWLLDLIAARAARIVERGERAVVLLIHGWNVIEPRVDIGIGVRSAEGAMLPACEAHVSASDALVNGPLTSLMAELRRGRIEATFGLRYPGAGADNLLQAFTRRHAASPVGALGRLAALSAGGALEAVQLELSVALRIPGRLRAHAIAAIAGAFARRGRRRAGAAPPSADQGRARIEIVRTAEPPARARKSAAAQAPAGPRRVGLEFYDPSAQIGVLASFDLGAAAAGARVMVVAQRDGIALFTAEGRVERTPRGLALGPLALRADGGGVRFDFAGPAVAVADGAAYLSVERALARAALCETMELHAEFEPWRTGEPYADRATLIDRISGPERHGEGIFGRVGADVSIGGARHRLDAIARLGGSFVGIGNGAFAARRMIWAAFPDGASWRALEARALVEAGGAPHLSARGLDGAGWIDFDLRELALAPDARRRPPRRIGILLDPPGAARPLAVEGEVRSFVMLSRPGPSQSRIVTSLGFAAYSIGGRRGAGMFERSYRSAPARRAADGRSANDADNG